MSRLVSAEEARGLLADVSHTLPWRDYKYGILRSDDVPCSYVVSWDYAVSENDRGDAEQLFTEIILKAPDLAATVIALSEERDHLRATLYREGYAPCSSAACNCGDWHK